MLSWLPIIILGILCYTIYYFVRLRPKQKIANRSLQKQCPDCKKVINKEARVCPYCRRKFGLTWPAKIFILLCILGAVGYWNSLGRSGKDTTEKVEKAMALRNLEVLQSNWHTGGFESVGIWEVTFYNKSDKPIGNIKYRTTYYAETGNKVDSGGIDSIRGEQTTIRKVIMPGQKRTVEINDGFLHHEAHKAVFEVVSCEFVNPQ